jgi:hypothetical protein
MLVKQQFYNYWQSESKVFSFFFGPLTSDVFTNHYNTVHINKKKTERLFSCASPTNVCVHINSSIRLGDGKDGLQQKTIARSE